MLRYDIRAPPGAGLPALIAGMLPAQHVSPGDAVLGMPGNVPESWAADFPEYVYTIPELNALKVELNTAKSALDKINADRAQQAAHKIVSDQARPLFMLRHPSRGLLPTKRGAEVVTNAWLKMYEAMALLLPSAPRGGTYRTLHLAEAPGNFMLAINHYLYTHFASVKWTWYANSYRSPYSAATTYLGDAYGIMSGDYADRWLYGADGDGDITSSANLRSFRQHLEAHGGLVDMVTSDVKVVFGDNNFYEEENINIPVTLGHLLGTFMCLREGGNMLLKEFTKFESASLSILLLATMCFAKVQIIKPLTSRDANSEIYILGLGYRAMPVDALQRLLELLEYYRELNKATGSPSLFRQAALPAKFVESVVAAQRALAAVQIAAINRNVELTKHYSGNDPKAISATLCEENMKDLTEIKSWMATNPVAVLPEARRLARNRGAVRGGRGGRGGACGRGGR